MSASSAGIQRAKNIVKYYKLMLGLDRSPVSFTHWNYLYNDGCHAHAFLCTDLMKPRFYQKNPNNLSHCRVTIRPDGTLF